MERILLQEADTDNFSDFQDQFLIVRKYVAPISFTISIRLLSWFNRYTAISVIYKFSVNVSCTTTPGPSGIRSNWSAS